MGFLRAPDGTITVFDVPGAGTGPGQGTIGGYGVSPITFSLKVRSTSASRARVCASIPGLSQYRNQNNEGHRCYTTLPTNLFRSHLPPFPVLTFYKDEDNTPFPPKYSRGRESRCCTQAALASSRTTHAATTHRTRSLKMTARSHPYRTRPIARLWINSCVMLPSAGSAQSSCATRTYTE